MRRDFQQSRSLLRSARILRVAGLWARLSEWHLRVAVLYPRLRVNHHRLRHVGLLVVSGLRGGLGGGEVRLVQDVLVAWLAVGLVVRPVHLRLHVMRGVFLLHLAHLSGDRLSSEGLAELLHSSCLLLLSGQVVLLGLGEGHLVRGIGVHASRLHLGLVKLVVVGYELLELLLLGRRHLLESGLLGSLGTGLSLHWARLLRVPGLGDSHQLSRLLLLIGDGPAWLVV